jgi:uncharacterized coiled-coil DUF342 family protein
MSKFIWFLTLSLFFFACNLHKADDVLVSQINQITESSKDAPEAEAYMAKIKTAIEEVEEMRRQDSTNLRYTYFLMPLNDLKVMAEKALSVKTLKTELENVAGKMTAEEAKAKFVDVSTKLSDAKMAIEQLNKLMQDFDRRVAGIKTAIPRGITIK